MDRATGRGFARGKHGEGEGNTAELTTVSQQEDDGREREFGGEASRRRFSGVGGGLRRMKLDEEGWRRRDTSRGYSSSTR